MKSIKVSEAKAIREQLGMTHVVIFAVSEDGKQHVATHGLTRTNAQEAAKAGNKLKSVLGWPDDLCRSEPVRRTCENCVYYKPDYGMWCFNGWSGDGSQGKCLTEPTATRTGKDSACLHFEPK